MAYLRNDAVNRVNLHSGIQALAQGAGGVFFVVFLLRAGISVPHALIALAAIVAGRFALRPAILPLAKRWGLKPLLVAGTLGMAMQYPVLAEVDGVGVMLFVLVIVTAVADIFYWPAYHAYFATIGDTEHRGHQIGAREALVSVVGIVAPLIGAWAVVTAGGRATFAGVALIQVLAVLPLIGAPNIPVRHEAPGAFRAARLATAIIVFDGWFDACFIFVWQIALFYSLKESIPAYGGAMALAGLAGAAGGLALGRHIDLGHGRRMVLIGFGATAIVVAVRAASVGFPWLAVIANALGALVMPLLVPGLGTATYNMAKASPCPFRFNIAVEAGWDIGSFVGCITAAALAASGLPLSDGILLALPALTGGALILWHYYGLKTAMATAGRVHVL